MALLRPRNRMIGLDGPRQRFNGGWCLWNSSDVLRQVFLGVAGFFLPVAIWKIDWAFVSTGLQVQVRGPKSPKWGATPAITAPLIKTLSRFPWKRSRCCYLQERGGKNRHKRELPDLKGLINRTQTSQGAGSPWIIQLSRSEFTLNVCSSNMHDTRMCVYICREMRRFARGHSDIRRS